MSNQQLLAVSITPRPFGVHARWTWPAGSKAGDVMHVQALRKGGLTPVSVIQFPKDRATIGALHVGESIQVRARMTSDAGEFPDWQASDWRDAEAESRIEGLMSDPVMAIGRKVVEPLCPTLGMTVGDDIEQQTLRDVLADILPRTADLQMRGVAVTAAKAIRAAFNELTNNDAGKS